MKDKTYNKITKDEYRKIFLYLMEATTPDYAVNLEFEYGIEEVILEAIKFGYREV